MRREVISDYDFFFFWWSVQERLIIIGKRDVGEDHVPGMRASSTNTCMLAVSHCLEQARCDDEGDECLSRTSGSSGISSRTIVFIIGSKDLCENRAPGEGSNMPSHGKGVEQDWRAAKTLSARSSRSAGSLLWRQ